RATASLGVVILVWMRIGFVRFGFFFRIGWCLIAIVMIMLHRAHTFVVHGFHDRIIRVHLAHIHVLHLRTVGVFGIARFVLTGIVGECREGDGRRRSEEHTSELQSRENLVCRLLLEKKKTHKQ